MEHLIGTSEDDLLLLKIARGKMYIFSMCRLSALARLYINQCQGHVTTFMSNYTFNATLSLSEILNVLGIFCRFYFISFFAILIFYIDEQFKDETPSINKWTACKRVMVSLGCWAIHYNLH